MATTVFSENATVAGTLRKTAVSHIGFRVPDVEGTSIFYQRILGMVEHARLDNGGIRLGWGVGHHVVDLYPGEQTLLHYGFEVRDEGGLDGIRERLTAAAIPFTALDAGLIDECVGLVEGLVVDDPDGTPVHFHSQVQRSGENSADTGRRPIKFQHTTLASADAPRIVDFFVNVIGFKLTDKLDNDSFFWMRSDLDHHTLACVETGVVGDIDHYSYDLAEWADFKDWSDRLTELGVDVQWGPGRHGPGNNLFVFFDDPAGNHVELSAEMEKFHDDIARIHHREWTPAPKSVNLWGGQTPKWRRVGPKERAEGTA